MYLSGKEYMASGEKRYYFRCKQVDYVVIDRPPRRLAFKVGFSRVTSNVFGNGSDGVIQSGYRSLPEGPKRRELQSCYERAVKTGNRAL